MRIGLDKGQAQYEEYKRRLDARAVLEHYGLENDYERSGPDGTTEVIHSCLLDKVEPHHSNGDMHPSASCNLEKKLYVCYSYWGGDLFHLIMKMEGKDELAGIIPVLGRFLGDAVAEHGKFLEDLNRLFGLHHDDSRRASDLGFSGDNAPVYSDRVLRDWEWPQLHPYLVHRGIRLPDTARLHLGYDLNENRIVFPHFWHGKLVGWQKRAIPAGEWPSTDDTGPKYRNSTGFPKAETLYGYDYLPDHKRVVVVESPMSVAKAHSLGFDRAVATFGAQVSQTQINLLKRFGFVTVWMDDGPAGRAGEKKVVKGLHRHTRVWVVPPDTGKDMADCHSLNELQVKLGQAVSSSQVLAIYEKERIYGR